MTTATADPTDPTEPAEEPKSKRPGPAQPPTPQPSPQPQPRPPVRPPTKSAQVGHAEPEGPEGYADDPAPAPEPGPPPAMDERLVGVGRRLQLLVESSTEHIGEARAVAGVLRPDGAAYGRMEGLLQGLEYDKEALGRAIEHLRVAAQALAAERAPGSQGNPGG